MGSIITQDEPTIHKFEEWLRSAKPDARYEYHRGLLVADRESVVTLPSGQVAHVFYEPTHSLAQRVWRAYEKGWITLVQKREDGQSRYFAIKRRKQ